MKSLNPFGVYPRHPRRINVADRSARLALASVLLNDVAVQVGCPEVSRISGFTADVAGSLNSKSVVLQNAAGSLGVYNRVAARAQQFSITGFAAASAHKRRNAPGTS